VGHELPEVAAGVRWRVRGAGAGARAAGAIVVGVVAGASVAAGAVIRVVGAGAVAPGAATLGAVTPVVAVAFVGAGSSAAGASVAGGVVGEVAWAVETAANPARSPTPATPPAAIHRVAVAARAVPWARARVEGRSSGSCGRRRLGGSSGWMGIGFLVTGVPRRLAWAGKRTAGLK